MISYVEELCSNDADMNDKGWSEHIADLVLFVFILSFLPAFVIGRCITEVLSSITIICNQPVLEGLYKIAVPFSILSFNLFVEVIVLVALIFSVIVKIRRFARGYRPQTVFAFIVELTYLVLFFVVLFLFRIIYSSL